MKSQSGQGLVEIVVASGILSVVILASVSVMKMQADATKQAQQLFEANYFQNEIYTALRSKDTCAANFLGVDPSGGPSVQNYNVFNKSSGGVTTPAYSPGQAIGNRTLEIPATSAFQLHDSTTPVGANSQGTMTLQVNMDRSGTDTGGKIFREVVIQVNTDASGKVSSCSTNFEAEKLKCIDATTVVVDTANQEARCPPGYRVMAGQIKVDSIGNKSAYSNGPKGGAVTDPITKTVSTYERWYCRGSGKDGGVTGCKAKCCSFASN